MEQNLERQIKIITKGTEEIVPHEELIEKVKRSIYMGVPLRVKLGLDPSAPDIHLGHSVVLRKLRQFQDLGHHAVLIIGDFTGMVGDPTNRSETRKRLSAEQVRDNAKTYADQILRVLDPDRIEVVYNSDWFSKMSMADVLEMTSQYTVARMLERDDFARRYAEEKPISIVEFMYPLLQGTDSVKVRSDIELGGTDQKFNLLVGRDLQRLHGQEPQVVLTMPLLEGTDGVAKMSKSLGNYIGLTEPPDKMFGKIMSIPDELIIKYYLLATDMDPDRVNEIKAGFESGNIHPGEQKRLLAKDIIILYYSVDDAAQAEEEFDRVFKDKGRPSDIPTFEISLAETNEKGLFYLPKIITDLGFAPSNSDARRMITQGGVKIDDNIVSPDTLEVEPENLNGKVIQVGKRHFAVIAIK